MTVDLVRIWARATASKGYTLYGPSPDDSNLTPSERAGVRTRVGDVDARREADQISENIKHLMFFVCEHNIG